MMRVTGATGTTGAACVADAASDAPSLVATISHGGTEASAVWDATEAVDTGSTGPLPGSGSTGWSAATLAAGDVGGTGETSVEVCRWSTAGDAAEIVPSEGTCVAVAAIVVAGVTAGVAVGVTAAAVVGVTVDVAAGVMTRVAADSAAVVAPGTIAVALFSDPIAPLFSPGTRGSTEC